MLLQNAHELHRRARDLASWGRTCGVGENTRRACGFGALAAFAIWSGARRGSEAPVALHGTLAYLALDNGAQLCQRQQPLSAPDVRRGAAGLGSESSSIRMSASEPVINPIDGRRA